MDQKEAATAVFIALGGVPFLGSGLKKKKRGGRG